MQRHAKWAQGEPWVACCTAPDVHVCIANNTHTIDILSVVGRVVTTFLDCIPTSGLNLQYMNNHVYKHHVE